VKNKPIDLNNHLFAALERLNDESIVGEELKEEIERGRAISGLAKQVIDQQKNIIMIEKMRGEPERKGSALPELLGG
jgi:predicted proteasome-type protease